MKRWIGAAIGIAVAAGALATGFASGGEIPERARASLKEALAAVREAKSADDYGKAERAFEEAVRIAPEWADAYAGMAALAEAMGKQVKAIRSYERYLELAKDAPDRDPVRSQIAKLRTIRAAKRKVGMAGVTLMSLKDGIYIASVVPGSRIEKAGFRKGDRITQVNGQAIPRVRLEEFYQWVDGPNAEERSFRGRFSRHRWGYGRVKFTVVRGGEQQELDCLPAVFSSKVQEIEEEEIEEWISGPKPVIVTFWAHWCPPCRNFVQVLEDLAERYAGRIEFTMIGANGNPKAVERFQATKLPTTILFRNGKPAWRVEGFKDAKEIEEMLRREGIASGPSTAPGQGTAARTAGRW
ncbi:MAG: hypothetical protein OHK0028_14980 [Deltaproteobacteria bacterium]